MGLFDKYISKKVNEKLQPEVERQLQNRIESIKNEQQRSFEAAQISQLYSDWATTIRTINSDIRVGHVRLVARSREAAKNDPYAKKSLRLLTKNVLGHTGPTFRNKAFDWGKDDNGAPKKIYDDLANLKIQNGWAEWCKRDFCTASKRFTLTNFSRISLQTTAQDGECFIVKMPVSPKKNKFGFTQKLYETEYVDINLNYELSNGNFIFMGVELDQDLNRIAYYFKKFRFSDQLYGQPNPSNYQRVEAQFVNHLFYPESYFQIRGIPWNAPNLIRQHMLNAYEEAITIKARIAASAPFVLEPKDQNQKDPAFGIIGGRKDTQGNIVKGIEVGEPWISPRGYETKFPDTKTPSGQESPFIRQLLYDQAAGYDISGMSLSGDYTGANFTVSRTALNDEREGYKVLQEWIISDYFEDIFADWLMSALLYQAVQLPLVKYDKFNNPWFYGRRWQYVQPRDDAETDILMIDNNLDTVENRLAERSLDYEEVMDRREFEVEDMKRRGIYIEPAKSKIQPSPQNADDNSNPVDDSKPVDDSEPDPKKNGKANKNLINQLADS